jgi:hypothetical protein
VRGGWDGFDEVHGTAAVQGVADGVVRGPSCLQSVIRKGELGDHGVAVGIGSDGLTKKASRGGYTQKDWKTHGELVAPSIVVGLHVRNQKRETGRVRVGQSCVQRGELELAIERRGAAGRGRKHAGKEGERGKRAAEHRRT